MEKYEKKKEEKEKGEGWKYEIKNTPLILTIQFR